MEYLDLLGKGFRYGGRGPDQYDCYGLCMELYRRRGVELPSYISHADPLCIDISLADGRRNYLHNIPAAEPFCLVLFCIAPPFVSHIGIVMEDCQRFIHIMHKSSVSIERLDSDLWENKVAGFYRYQQCKP